MSSTKPIRTREPINVQASRLHAQPGRPRHKARHAGVPDGTDIQSRCHPDRANETAHFPVIPTERTK